MSWTAFFALSCTRIAGWNSRLFLVPLSSCCQVIQIAGQPPLETRLKRETPAYRDHIARTSGLIPWFPRRVN